MKMFNVAPTHRSLNTGQQKSNAHKLITITASSPNLIPLFAFSFSFFHSWKNCSAAFTLLFFPWIWLSPLLFHIFMFKLLPPLSNCAWLVLSLSFPDLSELIISTLASWRKKTSWCQLPSHPSRNDLTRVTAANWEGGGPRMKKREKQSL